MRCQLSVQLAVVCLAMAGSGSALPRPAEADWDEGVPQYRPEDLVRPPRGVTLPLAPAVNLTEGTVNGLVYTIDHGRTFLAYQGIPFGEPPTGDNRFKAPVKKGYYGDLNATYPSYNCPQSGIQGPGTEDCLYLNVYTTKLPEDLEGPLLPVMVFIYGGGFTTGGSSLYYPDRLQRNKDIVVVTPHYRLGVLGSFTTLTDEAPGNLGLLDQVLALQWVQDNIDAFGGDPDRVTIFGESAGGASVSLLLVSPLAKGLFHAAIAESGSAVADWAYNSDPLVTGRALATKAGCPLEQPALLQCLRDMTAQQLVRLGDDFSAEERKAARNGFDGLNPIIQPDTISEQNRFLPKDPVELITEGNFNKVPTIHGTNKNEGSFIFGLMYNDYLKENNLINDTDFLKNDCIQKMLYTFHINDPTGGVSQSIADNYFYYVDSWDVNTMYPGLEDLTGLFGMKAGAQTMAQLLAEAGVPSWMYSFEYRGRKRLSMAHFFFMGRDRLPFDTGVTHADELIYLFPFPLMTGLNEEETQVSHTMTDMWTNFAIHHDPTPANSGLTRWPQVSESGAYLQIAATTAVKHDYSQTFDVAVQERVNGSVTTPAPTSPSPPASSSSEPSWQHEMERLTDQRDTYRDTTIGLAVLAGVGALLLIVTVTMLRRGSRRSPKTFPVS
ncbi:carboxylesterase 1C-like [Amphibalanus amphitrite]|uniref:carboxylesterase 1C-like n=1 Tax=Amphibalanus amphitrite TaxID=1232801 RepID=UPI001C90C318|nr:carboxylesterase 1C-like [Amphibalanus amphitrite]